MKMCSCCRLLGCLVSDDAFLAALFWLKETDVELDGLFSVAGFI